MQITYSPLLSTTNEGGLNIIQLQPSPKLFSSMIIGMMRYFQWNRLFILSSNASLYKMVCYSRDTSIMAIAHDEHYLALG